jgi:hypothetical protein
LICKNCGQFFVRYPCPACGEIEEEEMQKIADEETLRKPSEMIKEVEPIQPVSDEDEALVRPSQIIQKEIEEEEEERDDEHLVKPSSLKGGSAVNPKFDSAQQQVLLEQKSKTKTSLRTQKVTPIHKKVQQIQTDAASISINSHLKSDDESEEEYKMRVRDTLLEVMNLLEKLIE